MPMQQQQPPVGRVQEVKNVLGWILFVARALAVSVEVFLHRWNTFGERYPGPYGAVALAIIFVFPALYPQSDPQPMLWFLGLTFFSLFMVRAHAAASRHKGGNGEHSYYSGFPSLTWCGRRMTELEVKSTLEPALVISAGLIVHGWNEPLGVYLILAGIGLAISVGASVRQERSRAVDMNDALLEQQRLAGQWRDRQVR